MWSVHRVRKLKKIEILCAVWGCRFIRELACLKKKKTKMVGCPSAYTFAKDSQSAALWNVSNIYLSYWYQNGGLCTGIGKGISHCPYTGSPKEVRAFVLYSSNTFHRWKKSAEIKYSGKKLPEVVFSNEMWKTHAVLLHSTDGGTQ